MYGVKLRSNFEWVGRLSGLWLTDYHFTTGESLSCFRTTNILLLHLVTEQRSGVRTLSATEIIHFLHILRCGNSISFLFQLQSIVASNLISCRSVLYREVNREFVTYGPHTFQHKIFLVVLVMARGVSVGCFDRAHRKHATRMYPLCDTHHNDNSVFHGA